LGDLRNLDAETATPAAGLELLISAVRDLYRLKMAEGKGEWGLNQEMLPGGTGVPTEIAGTLMEV
jgi:hypothetical protein